MQQAEPGGDMPILSVSSDGDVNECPHCGDEVLRVMAPAYLCVSCGQTLLTREVVATAMFVQGAIVLVMNGRDQTKGLWQLPRIRRLVFETSLQAAWRGFATHVLGQPAALPPQMLTTVNFLQAVTCRATHGQFTQSAWAGKWPESVPFVPTTPIIPPTVVGGYLNIHARMPDVVDIQTFALHTLSEVPMVDQAEVEVIMFATRAVT